MTWRSIPALNRRLKNVNVYNITLRYLIADVRANGAGGSKRIYEGVRQMTSLIHS
jgi:hypothetical protein